MEGVIGKGSSGGSSTRGWGDSTGFSDGDARRCPDCDDEGPLEGIVHLPDGGAIGRDVLRL